MKDPIGQIKAWLFPSIITVLAAIIWNDVKEIKTDVKALMAQSNIDKTRIDNIERQLYGTSLPISNGGPIKVSFIKHDAALPNNKFRIKSA
jgi:hypothetical protein